MRAPDLGLHIGIDHFATRISLATVLLAIVYRRLQLFHCGLIARFPTILIGTSRLPGFTTGDSTMLQRLFFPFALILLAASVFAQDTPQDNSAPPPPPAPRHGGVPPCLRQAGVSMSVMDQLRSIEQDAHAQVQNLCSDPSLNRPQRMQQLESIHMRAHEKMEELVTPEQRRIFVACRQRHRERAYVEWFERPGGGCNAGRMPGDPNAAAPNDGEQRNDQGNGSAPPPQSNEAPPQKNESSPQRY
jgi:hypothetical protein